MLENFRILGKNMNIKAHFFPENLDDVSDEKGEILQHDIKLMK